MGVVVIISTILLYISARNVERENTVGIEVTYVTQDTPVSSCLKLWVELRVSSSTNL